MQRRLCTLPTAFCQEAHFHEDSLHLHLIAFVLSATHFDPLKKRERNKQSQLVCHLGVIVSDSMRLAEAIKVTSCLLPGT